MCGAWGCAAPFVASLRAPGCLFLIEMYRAALQPLHFCHLNFARVQTRLWHHAEQCRGVQVIMWELATRQEPWADMHPMQVRDLLLVLYAWAGTCAEAYFALNQRQHLCARSC